MEVNLRALLFTMQDVKVELHIFKNWSHSNAKCEEVEKLEGTSDDLSIHFMTVRKDYNWHKLEAFYIGYAKPRSRTIKINAEIVE